MSSSWLPDWLTPARPEAIAKVPTKTEQELLNEIAILMHVPAETVQDSEIRAIVKNIKELGYEQQVGKTNKQFITAWYASKMKKEKKSNSPKINLDLPIPPLESIPDIEDITMESKAEIEPDAALEPKVVDAEIEKKQTEPSFDDLLKVMDLNFQNVLNLTPKELDKLKRGKRPLSSLVEPLMAWLREKKIRTGADLARRIKRKLRLRQKGSNATPLIKKITKEEKSHVIKLRKAERPPKRQKISKLVEKIIDS